MMAHDGVFPTSFCPKFAISWYKCPSACGTPIVGDQLCSMSLFWFPMINMNLGEYHLWTKCEMILSNQLDIPAQSVIPLLTFFEVVAEYHIKPSPRTCSQGNQSWKFPNMFSLKEAFSQRCFKMGDSSTPTPSRNHQPLLDKTWGVV